MVDQRRIDDQRWVDARAAAKFLGIQVRSLYAYVSRGQVRSVPGTAGRPRLYAQEDLQRLRARRDARAGHGAVAASALRWGEPVLDSAITAITPRGPVYRGHAAVDLAAAGAPFENVAELLWSGYWPEAGGLRAPGAPGAPRAPNAAGAAVTPRAAWPRPVMPLAQLSRLVPEGARPVEVMPLLVQVAALADPDRADPRPDAIIARGRRLIALLAAGLAPGLGAAAFTRALGAGSVAEIAARALGLSDDAPPLIEQALVLLADHELNASSFAARVAASTGADPYACVTAALAALSGPRHGTASEEIARFADEIGGPEGARAAVRARRRRGLLPPEFGHPLYPDGDPRAPPLLAAARGAGARRARTLLAIVDATPDARPTVDVGLAAVVAALGAAPAAASGLFAVARAAGWIAHVLEQHAAGFLLRPRARYTGVPPAGA